MSFRSIVLGLILAMFLVLSGHFNDAYISQTYMVGNHFPIFIIGSLLLFVLLINPVLRLIKKSFCFSKAELAMLVILPLSVAAVPGSGFLRTFTPTLIMPSNYYQMTPAWQKNDAISYLPKNLTVQLTEENEEDVMGKFLQGTGDKASFKDVPWKDWITPLSIWLPLFFIVMVALICFSMVLHRQWASHEHLVYPISEFVQYLTVENDSSKNKYFRGITAQKLFWYGLIPVLIYHVINGIHVWYPDFILIPRSINLTALRELFPNLAGVKDSWSLFRPEIFFTVIAFAYFLPSDITLSLGSTQIIGAWFSLLLTTYGITVTNKYFGAGEYQGLAFGAYVGLFGMILFTGRAYYSRVAMAAFGKKDKGEKPLEGSSVWGFRIFILASLVAIAILANIGLGWLYATILMFLFVLIFTVMSRICAETGLFFIQPNWLPSGILLGFIGAAAIGPTCLVVMMMVSVILCVDPRESLMPFIINSFKIADDVKVKRGPLSGMFMALLAIGLVAGTIVVLSLQYGKGVALSDYWATRVVPQEIFKQFSAALQNISADGTLEESKTLGTFARLSLVKPNTSFVGFAITGLIFFLTFAFLRIRFSKWPLHPIIFLVWFTFPISRFGFSFFVGWLIKTMIVKLGGGDTYQRNKSFMVGMIAGDLLGGLIFMFVGFIYYLVTGDQPSRFQIFPG
jgi:hypothetical protein